MHRHVAAITLEGAHYPAYISVNTDADPNSDVRITVRGPVVHGREGEQATIQLTRQQFKMLVLGMSSEALA